MTEFEKFQAALRSGNLPQEQVAPEASNALATSAFIEALERPPQPNDKLREAFERYGREVESRPPATVPQCEHCDRPGTNIIPNGGIPLYECDSCYNGPYPDSDTEQKCKPPHHTVVCYAHGQRGLECDLGTESDFERYMRDGDGFEKRESYSYHDMQAAWEAALREAIPIGPMTPQEMQAVEDRVLARYQAEPPCDWGDDDDV